MRALKTISLMPKMLIRAVMQAVMAIVGLICRFFGGRGPAMPAEASLATTADDVADTYHDSLRRETANDHALTSDCGLAVHQYANAADPGIRSAVDLGGLDRTQMNWLLTLSDSDLAKLAAAGPKACGLAVAGRRCGIVGLPLPQPVPAVVVDRHEAVRALLIDRIRHKRRIQPVA